MAKASKDLKDMERLLTSLGFVLVRKRKHAVWKNGSYMIVLPISPSCYHALKNAEAQLRRDGFLPRKGS